jgi:AraC-like DNA-binding protein
VLSAIAKDHVYWFGRRGFIFTSPWVVTPCTVRHPAVVLLSANARRFELSVGSRRSSWDAVAIAPHVRRGLRAVDVGLVSLHVEAHHPFYGAFRAIEAPGVQRLERSAFRRFDAALSRAYQGQLTRSEAHRLFDALVATAVAQLPELARCDGRAELLRAFLRDHPGCSLADVARELDVSYARASRLFSRAMGMPLRTYQHWLKCMRAERHFSEDVPWTRVAHEAGFTDSSHLARTWQRSYGHSPSYIRDGRHVRVVD